MLKPATALGFLFGLAITAQAQTVALFAVNQPPRFSVEAGEDLSYTPGLTLQVTATGGTNSYSYLWSPAEFLDDPTSPTPMVQGLVVATPFTVRVTDTGLNCTLLDDVMVDFSTGIRSPGDEVLSVSPNPTTGQVRIHAPDPLQRVLISAPNGALVMELPGLAQRDLVVDLSTLPVGVYVMTLFSINGHSQTQKLCTTTAH